MRVRHHPIQQRSVPCPCPFPYHRVFLLHHVAPNERARNRALLTHANARTRKCLHKRLSIFFYESRARAHGMSIICLCARTRALNVRMLASNGCAAVNHRRLNTRGLCVCVCMLMVVGGQTGEVSVFSPFHRRCRCRRRFIGAAVDTSAAAAAASAPERRYY